MVVATEDTAVATGATAKDITKFNNDILERLPDWAVFFALHRCRLFNVPLRAWPMIQPQHYIKPLTMHKIIFNLLHISVTT
jgi:hypothetical protein